MTHETPKIDARKLSAEEYKAAVKELLLEVVEAERNARNARDQAAFEAKYKKDSKND